MSANQASVTDEQVKVFADHVFTWMYDGQHFRCEREDDETLYVGFTLSGKWVARHRDYRRVETRQADWISPAFDDPITALVHAETANWGRP